MERYLAVIILVLLILLVLIRSQMLRKNGIKAIKFGGMDKKDFFIIPFVLFYFYLILAGAFNWPKIGRELFSNGIIAWIGVVLCFLGLILFLYALISFGNSFRVGIDEDSPGKLITTGAFAISRNPIYTSFLGVMIGIFFIIPNWIFLLYIAGAIWLFNRQIKLEEKSLVKIYGEDYKIYCRKV